MKNLYQQGKGEIGIIILLVVIGLAIYGGVMFYQKHFGNNQTSFTEHYTPQISTASVEEMSKCAKDGADYINNYEITTGSYNIGEKYKPVWGDPQYHFNSKLNTCLAYIWYVQESYEWSSGDIASPNYKSEIHSTVYNFVFDIYSNKPILQSVLDRTTPWKEDNIDVVSKYPAYQDIPNLDGINFGKQLQVLINE